MTRPINESLMIDIYAAMAEIGRVVLLEESTPQGDRSLAVDYRPCGFPSWHVRDSMAERESRKHLVFLGAQHLWKAVDAYEQIFCDHPPAPTRTVEDYLKELERLYLVDTLDATLYSSGLGLPPSRLAWFADEWLDVMVDRPRIGELIALRFIEVLDKAADGTLSAYMAASEANNVQITLALNLPEAASWFDWADAEVPTVDGEGTITVLTDICGLDSKNIVIGFWDDEPTDCGLLHQALKLFVAQEVAVQGVAIKESKE